MREACQDPSSDVSPGVLLSKSAHPLSFCINISLYPGGIIPTQSDPLYNLIIVSKSVPQRDISAWRTFSGITTSCHTALAEDPPSNVPLPSIIGHAQSSPS